ncbi:hypothetical protein E4T56_gene15500 [Termitomyces sp. T112]|nr:hypothetical protein E4T56_gene15500 [Termitomyces sp. T112]
MAQRIFQGWEQQHEADLEEDFNDLGPQNDIPSEDDLEYVDPAQHQLAEQWDPPLDDPLGPQDDMSSDDGLEYVDPAQQNIEDLTEQSEVGSGMKQELQARAEGTGHSSSIYYATTDVGKWLCGCLFGSLLK